MNIIKHVEAVNIISVFLAKKLKEKGESINIPLVDMASLLHDLDKWACVNDKSLDHGFETEKILIKKGYPEVGFYARQHRADLIVNGLSSWEEKIIYYADKRVNDYKIVSLKERIDDLNAKYPPNDEKEKKKRKKLSELLMKLEEEIFSTLDIEPKDIKNK